MVTNDDVDNTLLNCWQYQLVMLVPITIDCDGTNENGCGTNFWCSQYSVAIYIVIIWCSAINHGGGSNLW